MARSRLRRPVALLAAAVVFASAVPGTGAAAHIVTGPSSSASPYVLPVADGVRTVAILTVGDAIDGYQMVGIPDGLGAFDNGDGTFTVLMNHELGATVGAVRAHGATGAFVSRWVIDSDTLEVESGADLIAEIATWNASSGAWNTPASGIALGRLCSADLAVPTAFYSPRSKQGFDGRLFLNGEEVGAEGRAFAHLEDGTSYELAGLGNLSFENVVANPDSGNKTIVVALDDSGPGEVYVYVGRKTKKGNPIERAGLAGGELFGIAVKDVPDESRATGIGAPSADFDLRGFGDVSAWAGADLQAASDAAGVTAFLRPEDGAWDPVDRDVFYFVTTDRFDQVKAGTGSQVGRSRLWRLTFDNIMDPEAGGVIDLLVDGTEPHQMFDNLTVDRYGHVLIQEDPGNQEYLARIWQYDVATDTLTELARHDPARFSTGAPGFLTRDEESSGIIDAESILGPGWFLLDVQAHYPNGSMLVEGGQLLALFNPDTAAAARGASAPGG
jgi:hypothetical protein